MTYFGHVTVKKTKLRIELIQGVHAGYQRVDMYCVGTTWVLAVLVNITPVINTLRLGKNGRYFVDDIFKCIFLNENVWIPIKISLKFVHKGPINNIPSLVQIMAWCRPGAKPLSEQMVGSLLTHICVAGPQWVNTWTWGTQDSINSLNTEYVEYICYYWFW